MEEKKNALLEVKGLCTYFFSDNGTVKAVDGVDFTLEENTTLGIVGESGSGKSVTAMSIMDLLQGTSGRVVAGEILLEGDDLLTKDSEARRLLRGSKIAMIFQEPMTSLNPVMKVGRQITEGILQHNKISKEEAKKQAISLLEETGLARAAEIFDEYPYQLSGGQRQRVMIAIALACQPKILIADEPTTALDVTIQAQILSLMRELKKKKGTAIIFVTHNLGVVANMCEQVLVMYCGRVVEYANVDDLFENPLHPYTQGLMDAIPVLGEHKEELEAIPGNVPNPKYMPEGCKFSPRCKYAMDICKEKEPELFVYPNGRKCRCWLSKKEYGGEL
ncbi:MAG: ABC transporter ATP-binding protein [Firmicutes bacterium]|nr:ABC transporter ATP-binding protein [Bacillota bacterium]